MGKSIDATDDAGMLAELAAASIGHAVDPALDAKLIEASRAAIARSKRLIERANAPYLMITNKAKTDNLR
jgi:hypothetical protein